MKSLRALDDYRLRATASIPAKNVSQSHSLQFHFQLQLPVECQKQLVRSQKEELKVKETMNSWFPNGFFRRNKVTNNVNLQRTILNLMEGSKETVKNDSPTLNELKNQKNKVKRMSSCYEENIESRKKLDKTPFSMRLESLLDSDTDQSAYVSFSDTTLFFTPKVTPPSHASKIEFSIQLMTDNDENYIKHMEFLITKYVDELDKIPIFRSSVPAIKTSQKEHLFGLIEKIYALHKERFHPMLLKCSSAVDVLMLANDLIDLCKEGFFNTYIIYAMDEKVSEQPSHKLIALNHQ